MTHAHGDFETRSTADLKAVGLWNYARHPGTDVWCFSYAFGQEEPELWLPGAPCPPRLREHVERGGSFYAHNAPFELAIWNEIMVPRYGWPALKPEQTHCTMAMAYAMGLPGGLEDAALALGLRVLKDAEGRSLMLRMARPRKVTVDGPIWWDEPEKLKRLYEYCKQDVRVERELLTRLVPLTEHEREVWLLDYSINQRGVAVDLESAKAGAAMSDRIKARAGDRLAVITQGAVTSPTALSALKEWCAANGTVTDSLDKEAVESLLESDLSDNVRAALVQRQEASKASVAKLDALMRLAGEDGRLHNWAQYYGAATGRWAARGVQVHNLIRDMPPAPVVDEILSLVRNGELDWLDIAYGAPMQMISQCLRSFFMAAPGHRLVGGDFSNVEGRGVAWISGEEWKLEAFRKADRKEGPGIYELTAHKTLGVPLEKITKDSTERQVGKVQELAFGYQGGVGAARKFLPRNMRGTPDRQINEWKHGWRNEHERVVITWRELEDAAIAAVVNPGETFGAGYMHRGVRFKKAGSFLWCRLPSGRVLCYPYPKLLPGMYDRDQLTYMCVPSENDKRRGNIIADPKNANNWARTTTYGGSLMENVVQAICRDLMADRMLALAKLGARIVLHVHDEIVIEVPTEKAEGAAQGMEQILRQPPQWAHDFPLWATCDIMTRYRKS